MRPECESTIDIKAKRDVCLILFEKTANPKYLKAAIKADSKIWTRLQTEHRN
jgi:rhamnogalacturonyl hydrolase YesR